MAGLHCGLFLLILLASQLTYVGGPCPVLYRRQKTPHLEGHMRPDALCDFLELFYPNLISASAGAELGRRITDPNGMINGELEIVISSPLGTSAITIC